MQSKNVLITGSSSGIGAEIATCLADAGFNVFLTGRKEDRLKKLSEKLNSKGYLAGDLHQDDFYKELYKAAKAKMGNVDILINNAGDYIWSPVEKVKEEDIEKLFRLNLHIPYNLCRLTVPDMKENDWGRIINIGSISGAVGEANASLYSASKSGLIGMTKALALELAEFGITINTVNPGWVKTELTDEAMKNELIDESEELEMIPQRRFISPQEIACMVKYLASDDARGVTGQSLNLCAGLSLG